MDNRPDDGTPKPDNSHEETVPAQQATNPEPSLSTTTAPAAWYPDPSDPTVLRYWDGTVWTEQRRGIPPPPLAPVEKTESAPPEEAPAPVTIGTTTAKKPDTDGKARWAERIIGDTKSAKGEDVDAWVGETEKAVARARATGSPASWQNAAQAARTVSEIAQTLQVMTHAHQIAEQRALAAEAAGRQATVATQAAEEAKLAATQTAQAAEQAALVANAAAKAADEARRKAEQTAQASPTALQSAHTATQAAADAKSTSDQLDQLVATARQANTPDAWSEALQIATAIWASQTGLTPSLGDEPGSPA
jgi:hypothetical protein